MAKKKKVDARPWVNRDDIVVYDGTQESVDKIHAKAKKLGGYVDSVRYSVQLKRLLEFKLHSEGDPDLFYMVPYRSAIVFTDSAIQCYISEELALSAVRVRTGRVKVTVTIERDDKVIEYLVPSASYVDLDDSYHYGLSSTLNIQITNPLEDEKGSLYYRVDRNMNPDWSYVKFLRGDYDGDEVSFS